MINQIAFLYCAGNNIFQSQQQTVLLSLAYITNKDDRSGSLIGAGVFLYSHNDENIRRSISLFSARTLAKHNWINDNNRYLGRPYK